MLYCKKYRNLGLSSMLILARVCATDTSELLNQESPNITIKATNLQNTTTIELTDWDAVLQYDFLVKQRQVVELADLGRNKEGLVWALHELDRVFGSYLSTTVQKHFIDCLIQNANGIFFMQSIEASLLALPALPGESLSYFSTEIRKSGLFCNSHESARQLLIQCASPHKCDDSLMTLKRKALFDLCADIFSYFDCSIWGYKELRKSHRENHFARQISLHGSEYTPEEMTKIGQYTCEHRFRKIVLHKENFKHASLSDFAKGIEGIESLTNLYFYKVELLNPQTFHDFVKAISYSSGIKYLNLSGCKMNEEHRDSLLQLITQSEHLNDLEICAAPLGPYRID